MLECKGKCNFISTSLHKSIFLSTCKLLNNLHCISGETHVCSPACGARLGLQRGAAAHFGHVLKALRGRCGEGSAGGL